ncbi:hypothetical protein D1AOALGA4SA_11288 [Olavius algarvensis Delta 1 endosymbiont]|nr:hypothetical protein D1AOALGA4SA_11288 [Olavius algarvensis Delta 1 endosymbiont]
MSNVEGRYSVYLIEMTERSLRLVEILAPTPRRAKPSFEIRNSIFCGSAVRF